jgi:hypothetical protein
MLIMHCVAALPLHKQGRFGVHWPMDNRAHMTETLGRKQMEKKRIGALLELHTRVGHHCSSCA